MQTTEKAPFIQIQILIDVPLERVRDLLCNAFEGGVGYWCRIMKYEYPEGKTAKSYVYRHCEVVPDGGVMYLRDCSDDDYGDSENVDAEWEKLPESEKEEWTLTHSKLIKGLQTMATKYPHHFNNFIKDNDDAETADVFVQCCLFGEIVYG